MSVNINNCNHFHQCDHNQTNGTGERVKHFQPVLTSTSAEYESDTEAENANHTGYVGLTYPFEYINIKYSAQHSLKNTNL